MLEVAFEFPTPPAVTGTLTLIMVLATRAMFWDGNTEMRSAWEALRASLGRSKPQLLPEQEGLFVERLHTNQRNLFKAMSCFWAVCSDLLLCCWPITSDHVLSTPQFWATILACSTLRYCSAPTVQLEAHQMNRVVLLLSMLCLIIGVGIPRQLIPALAVGRVMIGAFSAEPAQNLALNTLLSPLYFMVAWAKEPSDDFTSLANCFLAELFVLLQLALILFKLDRSLKHEIETTILMESKLQSCEASGLAARKLVAVTCDAFVRLTSTLTIMQPQQCLVDMLNCKGESLEGRSFLEYVSAGDSSRFRDQIDMADAMDSPASSLSLRLVDAVGTAMDTRIYHVCIQNPETDAVEHLIGITEAAQEPSSHVNSEYSGSRGRELASADMRHLLGYGVQQGGHLPSQSSGHSRSQRSRSRSQQETDAQDWAPLFGLEAVHLVLDASAVHDGFTIKSAKFQFRREMGEEFHGLLPNLLEWVLPKFKNEVFCWVQDHANAYMQGFTCSSRMLSRIQVLQPGTDDGRLLVGELEMVEMSSSLEQTDGASCERTRPASAGEEDEEEEDEDVFMHLEMRRFFFR